MTPHDDLAEDERIIAGATGYTVTLDGRVFSIIHNWRGYGRREMEQESNDHGYSRVRLTVNGKRKVYLVHKLVADAFLPRRPSPQHELRHLDGIQAHNHASNLAWGTQKDNALDRERHGRTARGEKNGIARLNEQLVKNIRLMLQQGIAQREIARRINISSRTVWGIAHGEGWTHVR